MSNLWTHLARGDVALAVTLTALSAARAVVWVPVLLNLSITCLVGDSINIRLPLGPTMLHIAMLTVLPVSLGMQVNRLVPAFARRVDQPVRTLSLLFLALAVIGILVRARGVLSSMMATAFMPVLGYSFLAMALGLLLARLVDLAPRQVITLPMEIGVRNGVRAATPATAPQFLGRPEVDLVPSVYGFTMSLMALGFIDLIRVAPGIRGRVPAAAGIVQSQPGRG